MRERADSLRALRQRIDSLPIPIGQVRGASEEVKSQKLPDTYPFYRSVIVTPDNELWVRRWTSGVLSKQTVIDVFRAESYFKTIVLPMDCATTPAIAARGRVVACMVIDPETDGESVVVAQLGS